MSFSLGGIFSGQLQAKAYKLLNGIGGLSGWRWLFILDGCISLPIALLGFALFPGLPAEKKPWRMTEDEHALAKRRVKDEGIVQSRANVLSRALLERLFTKWHFYLAIALYTLYAWLLILLTSRVFLCEVLLTWIQLPLILLSHWADGSLAKARISKRPPPLDNPSNKYHPNRSFRRFVRCAPSLHLTLHGLPYMDNRYCCPVRDAVFNYCYASLECATGFAL
jgi:MFS family permease